LAGGSFAVYRVLTTQEPTKPVVYDYPIEFHDSVSSNANVADDTLDLTFLDKDGQKLDLKQYRDQKVVVLVVTRGFSGRICAGCTTQTSRLMSNYAEFAKRDAEVLVVFPGPSEYVAEFLQKSQAEQAGTLPFPLLLDREFAAVDRLGIRADLAKPATYIIDKKGRVRFAYVGAHLSDRPSVKAMLEQLDSIAKNP
jgi:peroxiredoxin